MFVQSADRSSVQSLNKDNENLPFLGLNLCCSSNAVLSHASKTHHPESSPVAMSESYVAMLPLRVHNQGMSNMRTESMPPSSDPFVDTIVLVIFVFDRECTSEA